MTTVWIVTVIDIPAVNSRLLSSFFLSPPLPFPSLPATLNPSVVQALVEPLPLELAYLLFTTDGHKQTSADLQADYLNCFGKKLSVLANHCVCSVPDIIRKVTPLEVSRA